MEENVNQPAVTRPPLPSTPSTNSFTDVPINNGVVGMTRALNNRDDDDEDGDLLFMIEDEDGKGYWDSLFGLDVSNTTIVVYICLTLL